MCFKFNQNRTINEEIDFYEAQILSGDPEDSRGTRFQKFEKASCISVVQTYTQNFSTLAQLESV